MTATRAVIRAVTRVVRIRTVQMRVVLTRVKNGGKKGKLGKNGKNGKRGKKENKEAKGKKEKMFPSFNANALKKWVDVAR